MSVADNLTLKDYDREMFSSRFEGGVDDVLGNKAAWRRVFPMTVGAIPNSDMHKT